MRNESSARDPVFIGGLRSGTTIVCTLISAHSRYAELPELQFQSHNGGLSDLLAGRTTMERFVERMKGWYYRTPPARPPGLDALVSREVLDVILESFASSFASRPVETSRALILSLVEPRMRATGKASWVEGTPTTTTAASALHELLPEARFVHMVRDGRDAVGSLRRRGWGPHDVGKAVRWWGDRLRLAEQQRRAIPPDRFCAIDLADLVLDDRDSSYRRLLEFLGVNDEPPMRSFFETRVGAEPAHIGAWREELPRAERDELESAYASVLVGLRRDSVSLVPGAVAR
ncbi:MAG: sulfotransferase family protein [Solirubrobacterales bacterium]